MWPSVHQLCPLRITCLNSTPMRELEPKIGTISLCHLVYLELLIETRH